MDIDLTGEDAVYAFMIQREAAIQSAILRGHTLTEYVEIEPYIVMASCSCGAYVLVSPEEIRGTALAGRTHEQQRKIDFEQSRQRPFLSLEDFCRRVPYHSINERAIKALIMCGAMDSLPGTRRQKLVILSQARELGRQGQTAEESGQVSMFDLFQRGSTK